MKRTICALATVLITVLSGCSKSDRTDDKSDDKAQSSKSTREAAALTTSGPAKTRNKADVEVAENASARGTDSKRARNADKGDFKAVYGPTENKEMAQTFRKARLLEEFVETINNILAIPRDIPIELRDCDEPNAYYDPDEHRIAVCYQLIELFEEGFETIYKSDDDIMEATLGATLFTMYHELGHALVHELELPITGKEEDSVDQLATVILLAGGEEGEMMALDGAESFLLESDQDDFEELPFWDEHSLDEQRFFSIVCLVYGSNPNKFDRLVEDGDLPEERAERCPDEFVQIERSWHRLLEPHLKI